MPQDDLDDVLSFVNEPRSESLAPGLGKKGRSTNWLPVLLACLGSVAGLAFLQSHGIVPMPGSGPVPAPTTGKPAEVDRRPLQVAAVPVSPPFPLKSAPKPIPTPAARKATPAAIAPGKTPTPARPAVVAVKAAAKGPLSKARGADRASDAASPVELGKSPREVLEDKGLVEMGEIYFLRDQEAESRRVFGRNKANCESLLALNRTIFQLDYLLGMQRIAQDTKDNIHLNNSDLNIAMDSVPRWGGLRENSLNSVQKQMHYQLMNNRQDAANLDRLITDLRREIRDFEPRGRLVARFEELCTASRSSFAEADAAMTAVEERYNSLGADPEVKDAIQAANRETKSGRWLDRSGEFREELAGMKDMRRFLNQFPATRPARGR